MFQAASAALEEFEIAFPERQKDAARLRESITEDALERRRRAEARRLQAESRRQVRADLRQRAARRRHGRRDTAVSAADDGSSEAGARVVRPPTPVPPLNPFRDASQHAQQQEHSDAHAQGSVRERGSDGPIMQAVDLPQAIEPSPPGQASSMLQASIVRQESAQRNGASSISGNESADPSRAEYSGRQQEAAAEGVAGPPSVLPPHEPVVNVDSEAMLANADLLDGGPDWPPGPFDPDEHPVAVSARLNCLLCTVSLLRLI